MQKALKILLSALLFLLGIIPLTKAQLCTGSLGDPVVNITFGAGNNPGPPLKAATTAYGYVTSSCPNDGYYTVTNHTSGCFNNSWHTLNSDHTGDPNGYFMLINASFEPSDFYLDTVRNLCGGTTYEFAAWILNMMVPHTSCQNGGIRPNITFKIETTTGTLLQSYGTGDIDISSYVNWKQYALSFTTPANVSGIVLRMTNNAPGGCGNDLALDDITFRPCGPMVRAGILGSNGANLVNLCEDDPTILGFNAGISAGYNAPAYQWQLSKDSGTTWTDINRAKSSSYTRAPTGPGLYEYRLTVAEGSNIALSICRVSSDVLKVIVNAKPVTVFTVENAALLCSNKQVMITDKSSVTFGNIIKVEIYWDYQHDPAIKTTNDSPSTGKKYSHSYPYFSSPATQTFQVQYVVYSAANCLTQASQTITINAGPQVRFNTLNPVCEEVAPYLIMQARETEGFSGNGIYSGMGITAEGLFNPRTAYPGTDTIYYTFTAINGCSSRAFQTIEVYPQPKADTGPDTYVLEGGFVTLGSSSGTGNNISFLWTPDSAIDNNHIPAPKVFPKEDITYTLRVTSARGCRDSARVHVKVLKAIVVPNAFSPNGDGVNDVWVIRYLNSYPGAEVQVFNRYGQPVYHSIGYNTPWDGTYKGQALPVGTYYWIINPKNGRKQMSGSVTILR